MRLLDDSHGLSLSDQFWMRPEGSGISWRDVIFFDNDFDRALGLLTLGSISSFANRYADGALSGPNSSLGGNLRKAWERLDDGMTVLVKSGSAPYRQEPVSELIATLLYERLLEPGDYVPYDIELRDGKVYSVCEDMVDKSECFVSAWDIINAYKMPGSISPWMHVNSCYGCLGIEDAERQLSKMLACDYILANSDRHWNNFGVIFDAESMNAKGVAPIFDTGTSLWCWAGALDCELDYWYRPLPMIRERAARISPEDQLGLVSDFSWFDPSALDGFAKEVGSVLEDYTGLADERIHVIAKRVERNAKTVISHAGRSLAPKVSGMDLPKRRPLRP